MRNWLLFARSYRKPTRANHTIKAQPAVATQQTSAALSLAWWKQSTVEPESVGALLECARRR